MKACVYTNSDREQQLQALVAALLTLIPVSKELQLAQTGEYERALLEAKRLLAQGFTQAELSDLARSVPDFVERHKEWESQFLVQWPDGRWDLPDWFQRLDKHLQPAKEAADALRQLGYY